MQLIRTSMFFPVVLHERLKRVAKQEKKPVTGLVQELVDAGLKTREQPQLENIYAAWKRVCGIATGGENDLSVRIDELLYGENGAWRGDV